MSAAEDAAKLCTLRGASFRYELEAHLLHGYVYSAPDYFAMARPVSRSINVGDLEAVHPREECDAWFIWLAVGDLQKLLKLLPFDLPWVGWHRQGREWLDCHWVPLVDLRRRLEFRAPDDRDTLGVGSYLGGSGLDTREAGAPSGDLRRE